MGPDARRRGSPDEAATAPAHAAAPVAHLGARPRQELAVVACMDARLDPMALLGLELGDAHVIRNAGAHVTDDVLRSLAVSQHVLGTRRVVIVAHTGCGLEGLDEDVLRARIAAQSGAEVALGFGAFADLEAHVREQVERVRSQPWGRAVTVEGMILELGTGRLRAVA